jgi:hypothetical protein
VRPFECLLGACAFIAATALDRTAEAKEIHASDFDAGGAQTSFVRVRGSDRDGDVGALGFSTSRVGFGYEKGIAVRVVNTGSLAFGAKGIQGGIDSAAAGGYRFGIGRAHGIVVRGGYEAGFFGNKYLWDSMLELPQVQLGYQWLGLVPDSQVVDVAMKGGYVLFGRFDPGAEATRRLDGAPEVGAIASLHLGAFDLRAIYTRTYARHAGGPIDQLEGALCGRALRLIVCETVRYEVGDVRLPGLEGELRTSRVSFLGLRIGLAKKKSQFDD